MNYCPSWKSAYSILFVMTLKNYLNIVFFWYLRNLANKLYLQQAWVDVRLDVIGTVRTSPTPNPGSVVVYLTQRSGSMILDVRGLMSTISLPVSILSQMRKNSWAPKLSKLPVSVPTSTWSSSAVKTPSISESEYILSTFFESTKCCRVQALIVCRPEWEVRSENPRVQLPELTSGSLSCLSDARKHMRLQPLRLSGEQRWSSLEGRRFIPAETGDSPNSQGQFTKNGGVAKGSFQPVLTPSIFPITDPCLLGRKSMPMINITFRCF